LIARNITRGTALGDRVDVTGSLWAKFVGLMGRSSLAAGAGLWLPDSNGIHMMFMRFPIDAVFVGRAGLAGRAGADGSGPAGADDDAGSVDRDPAATPDDPVAGSVVRTVVSVHRALPAWRGLVPFIRGAHGVLELPVGTIDASGTQVGDEILFVG